MKKTQVSVNPASILKGQMESLGGELAALEFSEPHPVKKIKYKTVAKTVAYLIRLMGEAEGMEVTTVVNGK